MASQGKYQVVSQTELNQWDDARQMAIPGTRVTVKSVQSGAVFSVFVARDVFSPENVDALVRHQLEIVDDVHGLGQ